MKEQDTVYELGFHISPSITEGEVEKVVEGIKAAITEQKGSVFAEESPKITPLAYKIVIRTDAGATRYDKAYFGSIKFTAEPEEAVKVNQAIKANKNIIRFLLIKTDRANTIQFHKAAAVRKEETLEGEGTGGVEMDKQIDDLVVA